MEEHPNEAQKVWRDVEYNRQKRIERGLPTTPEEIAKPPSERSAAARKRLAESPGSNGGGVVGLIEQSLNEAADTFVDPKEIRTMVVALTEVLERAELTANNELLKSVTRSASASETLEWNVTAAVLKHVVDTALHDSPAVGVDRRRDRR